MLLLPRSIPYVFLKSIKQSLHTGYSSNNPCSLKLTYL